MPKIYFEEMFPELGVPKPTPAHMGIPKWWINMPKFFGEHEHQSHHSREIKMGTIRNCPAVSDIMSTGYTLYLPADIYIDSTEEELKWEYPPIVSKTRAEENFPYIIPHPEDAIHGMKLGDMYHRETIKIQTYWVVRTDQGYSTYFMNPVNRFDLPFHVVPAIVDTDDFPTHHPYAVYVKSGFKGIVHRGTPLMQLFPFKREDWSMEFEEFNPDTYMTIVNRIKSTFTNPYKKIFWKRKKYT